MECANVPDFYRKEASMKDQDKIQRTVLPIPHRPCTGLVTYDAKDPDTKFPPITQLRPPKGAPNVLIILIDDVGFGASSAFGGPIHTPTAELLAAGGLKYNHGSRGNEFTGRVKGVQLAIAEDAEKVDHLVSPEEAVRIAMAMQ
jgi:Sulfatase